MNLTFHINIPPPDVAKPAEGTFRTLVKISGDLAERPDAAEWVIRLAADRAERFPAPRPELLAVIGGGTQINRAFERAGIPYRQHTPMGREAADDRERRIIDDTLGQTRNTFQTLLADARVKLGVEAGQIADVTCSPPKIGVLPLNPKLFPRYIHVNGDTFVEACYLAFDEIFVLTVLGRHEAKGQRFVRLMPKVRLQTFPDQPPAP